MIRDRVQQTSTTSGTGTLSLDGAAPAGSLAFASVFASGASVYFAVIDGSSWEVIEGVFTTGGPPTLSRVRTLASSNGGSPVSFTGAAKQVFCDAPAELLGAMQGRLKAATTGNVSNAYTLALPVPVAGPAMVDNMEFEARINAANTGAVTLAVNGGAVKNVRKHGNKPLASGDWYPNLIAQFRSDTVNDCYVWMNAPESTGVKVVSTTTYTILAEDYGKLLVFTNGSGCAVTLPQATVNFASPWWAELQNASGGSVVVTPTTSTIDGAASLTIARNTGAEIRSDSTNYRTRRDLSLGFTTPVSAKTTTYNLLAADLGTEINFTTAGATLNLLAAATAGNGGIVVVRNSAASGDVTIDPNSAETLDGFTTRLVRPGDCVALRSDGTGWRTLWGDYTYDSGEQSIVAGGLLTLAHGLGNIPYEVDVWARCKTADASYSVGDEILVAAINYSGLGVSKAASIRRNATNILIRTGSLGMAYSDATTGAEANLTVGNWRYLVKARAK